MIATNAASALPILRELGAQGGGNSLLKSIRAGDTSMLKVWLGLEARKFFQASIESVGISRYLQGHEAYANCNTGREMCKIRSIISKYLGINEAFY